MTSQAPSIAPGMSWIADADAAFASALALLDGRPVGPLIAQLAGWRDRLDAIEARALASLVDADGGTVRAERVARSGGRTSKRRAKAGVKRAAAVAVNPGLADAMDSGVLCAEKVDAIATAMQTSSEAACDNAFIDRLAAAPVDQGRGLARDWASAHADRKKLETEHQRQRRARHASRYYDPQTGLDTIKIAGDTASMTELWNTIRQQANNLYLNDGGRDITPRAHARTAKQRLFDAAVEVLSGTSGGSAKPAAVLMIDSAGVPDLVGHGAISETAAIAIIERAAHSVTLHGLHRQPMAWGRQKRTATTIQFTALVVRDRGCVLCPAPWLQCQAHHLTPWNAPLKGETDLTNLALLCAGCHHQLHGTNHTLYRDGNNGPWRTRPATPGETPPAPHRPERRHRNQPRGRGATRTKPNHPSTRVTRNHQKHRDPPDRAIARTDQIITTT